MGRKDIGTNTNLDAGNSRAQGGVALQGSIKWVLFCLRGLFE
jgi:hypothetical protein